MTNTTLGRLEKVDLRTVWQGEATDFTPWLAEEANLKLLADTIGLELDLESTEQSVGPFRADIVCKDTVTDNYVLVENQLERTNHTHLGQLMTYAAGLNAVTVVWIADRFTDEHRAALDWLNEITDKDINFFGLEIELWRIGDSFAAPKFNIVSQPNDWTKTVTASRQTSGEISETNQLHLEYWTVFRDYLEQQGSLIQTRKPLPQHWYNFAIGRSHFRLMAFTGMRDGYIGLGIVMTGLDAKAHFHLLARERVQIEQEIGAKLEWRELPDNKQSDVLLYRYNVDPTQRDHWAEYHAWLHEKLEAFHKAFTPRIKVLDASEYIPPEDESDEADDDGV